MCPVLGQDTINIFKQKLKKKIDSIYLAYVDVFPFRFQFQFDVRMDRSIFEFELFSLENSNLHRIPVSVDEVLGVVCSVCQDGSIRMWNLRNGTLVHIVDNYKSREVPASDIPSAVFSDSWGGIPNCSALLACSSDGQLSLFCPSYNDV